MLKDFHLVCLIGVLLSVMSVDCGLRLFIASDWTCKDEGLTAAVYFYF